MTKFYFSIIIMIFSTSCVQKKEGEIKPTLASNLISITKNEDNGIKEILRYYNGICSYSIGFNNQITYFELKLSKSGYFKVFKTEIDKSARNIALLFYKNLEKERIKYDEIHVVIVLHNGSKRLYKIKTSELKVVDEKLIKVNQLISYLKSHNFDSIKNLLSDDRFEVMSKDEFLSKVKNAENQFGDINEFMTSGYRINTIEKNNILHLEGNLLRSIQPSEFSVDIDLNNKSGKILIFNYTK